MVNNKVKVGKSKLGLWSLLATGLVLGATALSGATTPIKEAQHYACTDSCYANYRMCLMGGGGQSYCAIQYQNCNAQCAMGSARTQEQQ